MDRFYNRNPTYLDNYILGPYFQKKGMKIFIKPIQDDPEATVFVALVYKCWTSYKNADIENELQIGRQLVYHMNVIIKMIW